MKKSRRPVRIDWDELEIAFDWNDPEGHAYLDLETGEVIRWSDVFDVDDLDGRIADLKATLAGRGVEKGA